MLHDEYGYSMNMWDYKADRKVEEMFTGEFPKSAWQQYLTRSEPPKRFQRMIEYR